MCHVDNYKNIFSKKLSLNNCLGKICTSTREQKMKNNKNKNIYIYKHKKTKNEKEQK